MPLLHPEEALQKGPKLPIIPACVHYAGSERFIVKSFDLQAELGPVFDIACDLEDGAPEGNEVEHREMVAELLRSAGNRHGRAGVRIHGPESALWQEEVDFLIPAAGERLAFITIPKVRELNLLRQVLERINTRSSEAGLKGQIPLHVLIETPQALQDAVQIATLPNIQALEFGLLDFISEHGGAIPAHAMKSPGQFEHRLIVRAKTEIAGAALMSGVIPSHNITLDLSDGRQAYLDARRAREEYGFLRMWSIHPVQIKPIVEAMTPSYDEVRRMEQVLLRAGRADWAPLSVDGELHDKASYRYFWDSLCRARAGGTALSEEAEQAFFSPREK